MNLIRMIARPLLAAPFIVEGWSALHSPCDHVARIKAAGINTDNVPYIGQVSDSTCEVLTRAMGAITLTSALALSCGKAPRSAAAVLATVAVPVAFINAPVWTAQTSQERAQYACELRLRGALAAAMLLASVDRKGRPSALWHMTHMGTLRGIGNRLALSSSRSESGQQ
ncbi:MULTISPECIES: DoxX family membrane protein [unclassified Schaalia]|uniref:DoxX family membrane protein n=1 Tax=unclassified Schaalia TaxID=2691889 RepID=UPI001E58E552|nr:MULTISPECIES: DoxX family membrane protein [unclassified Schaalia]MCD4549890.1 DoxX family membrane protein [Schaalia sp. lx-260]MCD4556906.1 DoxX family membrane protein [Schaalia sp. lx-100]